MDLFIKAFLLNLLLQKTRLQELQYRYSKCLQIKYPYHDHNMEVCLQEIQKVELPEDTNQLTSHVLIFKPSQEQDTHNYRKSSLQVYLLNLFM